METSQAVEYAELNHADRCDACGAQAKLRAQLPTGELLFCAHHGRRFREKLLTLSDVQFADELTRELVLGA